MFVNLKRHDRTKVVFKGIDKGKIFKIGIVGIFTLVLIKKNVLYVEGLKCNLLSICKLCDNGYMLSFNNDTSIHSLSNGQAIFTSKRKTIFVRLICWTSI